MTRAPLEQNVGEATRRGTDVEGIAARHVDGKSLERVSELHATAPDVRMIGAEHFELDVRGDRCAGLG